MRKSGFIILTVMALLLSASAAPTAMASGTLPQGTGGVTVTQLPNFIINGEEVTLRARCDNPARDKIDMAGFYVSGGGEGMLRIECAEGVAALSLDDSALFSASTELPENITGTFVCRAFVVCGGEEIESEKLLFDARPPLPPPAIGIRNGSKVVPDNLVLSWKGVEGAACYAVKLQDITKNSYLLGSASDRLSEAYYWVQGDTDTIVADEYKKLVPGRKYRFTVASAYDHANVYGSSVVFTAVSASTVKKTAPKATTGLYHSDGGADITLYGSIDAAGLQLSEYGFLAGPSEKSLERMPMDNPEQIAGGVYSMAVPVKSGQTTVFYRAYAKSANGAEKLGSLNKAYLDRDDPFEPAQKTAEVISKSYVNRLKAIDPGWAFQFIKSKPYNVADTGIELLNGWEEEHILKNFAFPGMKIHINKGALEQFGKAAELMNGTRVKIAYNDGSVSSFLLKDLVDTAYCYNSRYIYPSTSGLPENWRWSLSLHSWGASVDINARVQVNGQRGINFAPIKSGAAKLRLLPGVDADGALVFAYDGEPQQGKPVPDEVSNYILYELAFKPAGFYWGAYFGNNRTDAMHFTLVEEPAHPDIPLREAKELPDE